MPRRVNLCDLASTVSVLRKELRRCQRELRDLQSENEILREAAAPPIHQAAACERSRSSTRDGAGSR